MFELGALRAASVSVSGPPNGSDDSALMELAGRQYRFPVPAVPAARLPRDLSSLTALRERICCSTDRADPTWRAAVWTALVAPASVVPLIPFDGAGQEFAAIAVVDRFGHAPALAVVRIALEPTASKWARATVVRATGNVVADPDVMAEELERLFADALPEARATQAHSATRAMWLGGDCTVSADVPKWRTLVEAMGAVMGLRIEVVEDPARRLRTVETALGEAAPPAYLLLWQSMSRGAERLIDLFSRVNPAGEVLVLAEADFQDALVESRLNLMELGLADPTPCTGNVSNRPVPGGSEERFYIKVGGGKSGDALIDVPDCGHGQWGSNVRRKAPRAAMGVELLEGVRPTALFLCARCTKHRWRARFDA